MVENKLLIGVPGAGKTTKLVNEAFEKNWDFEYDTMLISVTNATIRALLEKMVTDRELFEFRKKAGTRTIYGLAFFSLLENGLLDEEKIKMLNEDFRKQYAKKNKISLKRLDQIDTIFASAFFRYNTTSNYRDVKDLMRQYNISINILNKVYSDYKKEQYYSFIFMLEESMKRKLNFFNLYSYHIMTGKVEKMKPLRLVYDEAQDIPLKIYKYEEMFDEISNLEHVFALDPAQEIFQFLGTKSDYILSKFDKNQIEYLTFSYRFGKNISDYANKLLSVMSYNYKIKTKSDINDRIVQLRYNDESLKKAILEIKNLYPTIKDTFILVRTHGILYEIIKKLKKFNVAYINLENYDFEKIKTAIDILQNVENKNLSFLKKKTVMDYLSPTNVIIEKIISQQNIPKFYFDIAQRILEAKEPVFYISTIHNVKGLEADAVILINKSSKLIEKQKRKKSGYINELKVYYVGVTRAKRLLYILRDPQIPLI